MAAKGAVVVPQTVVGQAQGLREQPALICFLGKEVVDPAIAVAGGFVDPRFDGSKRNQREDGVANFGIELAVQSPEAFGIQLPTRDLSGGEVAIV